MLIKSVRSPRDILIMSDDEFEQAQTQADYLSLADTVYYMDVLSRAYARMGKGTGDRTEFEMAVVKLSSAELDGTVEALTSRITALEKAVKKGITVNYAPQSVSMPTQESVPDTIVEETVVKETPKPTQIPETREERAEVEVIEPIPVPVEEPKKVPVTKPAPVPVQTVSSQSANIDEIYKNAKPFVQWVEVVNNLKPISRAIAAAFSGSSAYESGAYLLIDTSNEMAFQLLKNSSRREEIRKVILETTGRVYKLGPYKKPEDKKEETDPLQILRQGLEGSGIEITEDLKGN